MDFIQSSNKQVDKFGPGRHGFSGGNPSGGILATFMTPEFCDDVMMELINLIEGGGVTPTAGQRNQALLSVQAMISNAIAAAFGKDYKDSVRYTTTGNITLSGLGTQAGGDWPAALTAGNRILLKDQTIGSENVIYIAAAGAWTRAADADGVGELTSGAVVAVEEGATLADSQWMLTTDGAITIGTTALTWARKDGSIVPDASETVKGKVELATDAEAQAFTANKFIDGAKLNTALKGSNQSLNSSGYQKLPGGLIVQWGRVTTDGSSNATLTFPVAFPTALVAAVPGGAGGNYYAYKETSRSQTAVTHNLTVSSTGGGAASVTYDIIAIGY